MSKESMKRYAEVAAKLINNGNETCISCRKSKVYDGGGAFHWKKNFYLDCSTEQELDIYEFCKVMGINRNDEPVLDYGILIAHPELELKWHGDTVFITHKKPALTKEQKDFGHAFCGRSDWGFTKEQVSAMAKVVYECQFDNLTTDEVADILRKANVEVPDGITDKDVLVEYVSYLFEDVNYHDEAVLSDNGRYIGICRLWDIEW